MLSTDKQTNRQTDRQTNQRYQKHNLLCQGGNNMCLTFKPTWIYFQRLPLATELPLEGYFHVTSSCYTMHLS